MKAVYTLLAAILISGCATSNGDPDGLKAYYRKEYREGVTSAKSDLKRGILAYEDIQCEEEEGWRILWCYRKLLKDKYGIDYRVISPSPVPGALGQAEGYQSVVRPIIAARLGSDWSTRIFAEAQAYYRDHWAEVEHLYKQDREAQTW